MAIHHLTVTLRVFYEVNLLEKPKLEAEENTAVTAGFIGCPDIQSEFTGFA
jgi:hypothetical protein